MICLFMIISSFKIYLLTESLKLVQHWLSAKGRMVWTLKEQIVPALKDLTLLSAYWCVCHDTLCFITVSILLFSELKPSSPAEIPGPDYSHWVGRDAGAVASGFSHLPKYKFKEDGMCWQQCNTPRSTQSLPTRSKSDYFHFRITKSSPRVNAAPSGY